MNARNPVAWLVLGVDIKTLKVTGASICSEPTPTTMGSVRTVVLETADGLDFANAYWVLIRMLRRPEYAWVVPLLRGSEQEDVRRQP